MGAALVAFKRRKNLQKQEVLSGGLPRVLSLIDLTFLGVGSTLGAGVYVVAADIAKLKAGPAIILSFLLAALASFLCGLCYAEFGARVPKAGSAYVYAYVTVGELFAFIIGWNLILEYLIGAAAVASAWSSYIDSLANNEISYGIRNWVAFWDVPGINPYPNFLALSLCLIIMVLLIMGVRLSALFNTIMTIINILILIFTIVLGLLLSKQSNWSDFFPYGFTGVLRGSASAFFAFVGFDVIATSAEEAINPERTIPLSIFVTLIVCFVLYAGVGAILTLLVPYNELQTDAALPEAFQQRGVHWAKYVIGTGAVAGLIASTASSMLPVPRLLYSMADDGLLFPFLGVINKKTNTPVFATVITGVVASTLAFYFDLSHLVEMMSIGTLQAYTMVGICVLLLRYQTTPVGMVNTDNGFEPISHESLVTEKEQIRMFPTKRTFMLVQTATFIMVLGTFALAWLLANYGLDLLHGFFWCIALFFTFLGMIAVSLTVIYLQPQNQFDLPFRTPLVPFIPCLSVFFNAFLMMSLSKITWIRFFIWISLGKRKNRDINRYLRMGKKNSKIPPETLTQLRLCTAFSDVELGKWYKGFQKDCPSGRMTKKEFESIYRNFFKDGDASKFASHVFRTFDKNGDQSIDFREFICGLSITCHGSKEDKLRWAFNMYDIDKSGTITEDELTEIIRSIFNMMAGDDQQATEEDSPEKLAERLFLQMDEDGDGEVTLEEFVSAAKDNATILKLLQQ